MRIDLTQPPYCCDNTGARDCTRALIRALDDVLRPTLKSMAALEAELVAHPAQDMRQAGSYENRKEAGRVIGIMPELAPSRILYFPNGTYLVSDTVCYSLENLHNSLGNELNRQIILRGESREGVVLKLADNAPGFSLGANKPVLSFMNGERSNVAMANFLENMTVDTGHGNPGAGGVRFFCNNMGALRHVTLRSGDPEGRGGTGLLLDRMLVSCGDHYDIAVEGFDYGVQVLPLRMNATFEKIRLSGQRKAAFHAGDTVVAIRDLETRGPVPGLLMTGPCGHVTLLDSRMTRRDGPNHSFEYMDGGAAVESRHGTLFARHVRTSGYRCAVSRYRKTLVEGDTIEEYVNHPVSTLFRENKPCSLDLPWESPPAILLNPVSGKWARVSDFGATGDGDSDDTVAIQKAMDSGATHLCFESGKYRLNGTITVPDTVVRVNFGFADFIPGPDLQKTQAVFRIAGKETAQAVILEDLFTWEQFTGPFYLVEHASLRTLVLSDILCQACGMYFNSVEGGKVFLENVACTRGGGEFTKLPCLAFKGQKVWARQVNPERGSPQILNEHSDIFLLGFKTESGRIGFKITGNGRMEALGGVVNVGNSSPEAAFILNEESSVSVVAATNGYTEGESFQTAVIEIRDQERRTLGRDALPARFNDQFFIPLYTGNPGPLYA